MEKPKLKLIICDPVKEFPNVSAEEENEIRSVIREIVSAMSSGRSKEMTPRLALVKNDHEVLQNE